MSAWSRQRLSRKRGNQAWAVVPLLFLAGCQREAVSSPPWVERTRRAVERLPDSDRSPRGEEAVLLPSSGLLGLDTARKIAVRSNPDVHAAMARLFAAAARVEQAQSRFYPTVALAHNSARTFQTPASRNRFNDALLPTETFPTELNTSSIAIATLLNALRQPLFGLGKAKGDTNSFSGHTTSLTTSWILYDGFAREAQVLASKYLHQAAACSLSDVRRMIMETVDAAYHQVQLAEERLRIAEADRTFSEAQAIEVEKLRAAGRATAADVDNFRVRALSAQAEVTAAAGARDLGLVVLAELMGIADVRLPPDLRLAPLEEETSDDLTLPRAEEWIERALARRPDVQQLERQLDAEEENVRAAKGALRPTVVVSGSWGFDHSGNLEYSKEDQSSAAAIELHWDLYTGGARVARIREAEQLRGEIAANLQRLRLAVQSDVRRSIVDLESAQQRIPLQRETLSTALENRRVVQAAYAAGRETLSRLNETQRDVISAEAGLAEARIRLRRAWSRLQAAGAVNIEEQEPMESAAP